MKNLIQIVTSCLIIFGNYVFAQSIGQTKRMTLSYVGTNLETQGEAWNFSNLSNGQTVVLSWNDFATLPGFYVGVPTDHLQDYIGKQLLVDFIYMHHLCNEGSHDYDCTGWVVTGINAAGTPKSTRKIILPKIGKIVDPDGYVNVRSQMNVKSSIVGKLEPAEINHECFYFYACSDPNWYRIDCVYEGVKLAGYIHASRVKIIH